MLLQNLKSASNSQGLKRQFLLGNYAIANYCGCSILFSLEFFLATVDRRNINLVYEWIDPTQVLPVKCHKVRCKKSHSIKLLADFYIEHNLQYLLLVLLPKIASQGYEQNGCESTNTSSNFKPKIHCFTSAGLFFWQGNSFNAMLWLIPYI